MGEKERDIKMDTQKLISQGYRKISNKHRIISRIDKKNWVSIIYEDYFGHNNIGIYKAVETFYEGKPIKEFGFMRETVEYEAKLIADHYRRCYSKDTIEDVSIEIFTKIPSSNWDITGYCDKRKITRFELMEI